MNLRSSTGDKNGGGAVVMESPNERDSPARNLTLQSEAPSGVGGGGSYRCSICPKTFKRPEHLKRHEDTHVNDRPYACSTCGKSFARNDVLVRHTFIHSASRHTQPKTVNGTTQPRQSRACVPCAQARERCSRDTPCERCSAKALSCVYRASERRHSTGSRIRKSGSTSYFGSRKLIAKLGMPRRLSDRELVSVAELSPGAESSPNEGGNQPAEIHLTPRANDYEPDEPDASRAAPSNHLEQLALQDEYDARARGFFNMNVDPSLGLLDLARIGTPFVPPRFQSTADLSLNWLPISNTIIECSSILDLDMSTELDLAPPSASTPNFSMPTLLETAPNMAVEERSGRPQTAAWSPEAASSASGLSSVSHTSNGIAPGRLYATSSSARTPSFLLEKSPLPLILGARSQAPISKLPRKASLEDYVLSSVVTPPNLDGLYQSTDLEAESRSIIWPSTYDKMTIEFRRLCIDCQTLSYEPYTNHNFPTMAHFGMFIQLFGHKFIPALPLVHHTLCNVNDHWLLTLAMGAIGCQYTQTAEFDIMVVPLHEFLRRALHNHSDLQGSPDDQRSYVGALLLSQVACFYYGPSHMRSQALSRRGLLVQLAEDIGLFALEPAAEETNSTSSTREKWQDWIQRETKRRLGYTIWMLDVMTHYHFGIRPLLAHQIPGASLPHDALWTAPNANDWWDLFQRTERNPSLGSAVRRVFLEKQVKPDLGEFGRTLLLHGVFHEIHQVRVYYQRTLSSWVPAAQQVVANNDVNSSSPQNLSDGFSQQQWLLETEPFTAWRNASLDCVDALHWWANGVIALQSGRENPTVHHLHFSRIVLLVPVKEIVALMLSVTNQPTSNFRGIPEMDLYEAEQEVLRWAHRDESKARLAAIHCGCVFWHQRRFSAMAFYEPQSVFLATLSLWALSYYASRHRSPGGAQAMSGTNGPPAPNVAPASSYTAESEANRSVPEFDPTIDPAFIWLDRPNDDEMVQCFVRSGRPVNMKAYVSGVGDIYEANSPAKLLREGLKILESVAFAWGRDADYVAILQKAERAMREADPRTASVG